MITKLSYNVDQIEGGIGDRLGNFIQSVSTALGAAIMALAIGWKLALVSFSMSPFILASFIVLSISLRKYAAKEIQAYERAGSVAAEILTSIRVVFAFGKQQQEAERYEKELGSSARVFVMKSVLLGVGKPLMSFSLAE